MWIDWKRSLRCVNANADNNNQLNSIGFGCFVPKIRRTLLRDSWSMYLYNFILTTSHHRVRFIIGITSKKVFTFELILSLFCVSRSILWANAALELLHRHQFITATERPQKIIWKEINRHLQFASDCSHTIHPFHSYVCTTRTHTRTNLYLRSRFFRIRAIIYSSRFRGYGQLRWCFLTSRRNYIYRLPISHGIQIIAGPHFNRVYSNSRSDKITFSFRLCFRLCITAEPAKIKISCKFAIFFVSLATRESPNFVSTKF